MFATLASNRTATSNAAVREAPLSTPALALILLTLGVSYMFNGMDRQVFPALLGPIGKEFGLGLSAGGFLSTVFAVNIALFGALSGWFMGRFGRRATLVGGLLSYSLFTAVTPLATDFVSLATYRALTGAGEALHIGAIFASLGAYFGPRRGTAIGIVNAFFGIGAYLGPVLGTLMLAHSGSWRPPFYLFGAAGALAAVLVLIVVPTRFSEMPDSEGVSSHSEAPVPLRQLINRNLTLCALSFSLIGFTFFSYAALYATYLRTELGFTAVQAGSALGMYGIGTLGAFVGGWLGERLGMKGMFCAIGALTVVAYLMFHGVTGLASQSALSVCFGLIISGYLYPRFVSVMQRNVPAVHVGYAMAVAIPVFYLPGLVAGYAFGRITESYGWSVGASLTVALPAALALVLMTFYRPASARGA